MGVNENSCSYYVFIVIGSSNVRFNVFSINIPIMNLSLLFGTVYLFFYCIMFLELTFCLYYACILWFCNFTCDILYVYALSILRGFALRLKKEAIWLNLIHLCIYPFLIPSLVTMSWGFEIFSSTIKWFLKY